MLPMDNHAYLRPCEFPTDFLVSRLKGRRSHLPWKWDGPAAADPASLLHGSPVYPYLAEFGKDGSWQFMLAEYRWVTARMNRRLTERFRHYFLYLQVHELFVCLRLRKHGRRQQKMAQRLAAGLLDRFTKTQLLSSSPTDSVLLKLEQQSPLGHDLLKGWAGTYRQHGLQAVEEAVMTRFFFRLDSQKLHPVFRKFFSQLIDMRNLLTLHKYLHWQMKRPPAYIEGGTIASSLLDMIGLHRDSQALLRLAQVEEETITGCSLENSLLARLSHTLKKDIHEPTGTGFILFYFWEIFLLTRKASEILSITPLARGEETRETGL